MQNKHIYIYVHFEARLLERFSSTKSPNQVTAIAILNKIPLEMNHKSDELEIYHIYIYFSFGQIQNLFFFEFIYN